MRNDVLRKSDSKLRFDDLDYATIITLMLIGFFLDLAFFNLISINSISGIFMVIVFLTTGKYRYLYLIPLVTALVAAGYMFHQPYSWTGNRLI
jgi:hypothetical protein